MANMIQLIIVETPKDLKAIEIALENKEYPIVSSIVHKIKPSIKYFCVSKLLDDMIAIEAWENKDEMIRQIIAPPFLPMKNLSYTRQGD